jgi:hypothetical protein
MVSAASVLILLSRLSGSTTSSLEPHRQKASANLHGHVKQAFFGDQKTFRVHDAATRAAVPAAGDESSCGGRSRHRGTYSNRIGTASAVGNSACRFSLIGREPLGCSFLILTAAPSGLYERQCQ